MTTWLDGRVQTVPADDELAAEAARWGVSPSTVSQVRRGETWREVILWPA